MFLHPVGSVGHVVHSSASGVRNVDALFFMHGSETAGHVVHSGASGARNIDMLLFMIGAGSVWNRQQAHRVK
jgi:hypothetical protein